MTTGNLAEIAEPTKRLSPGALDDYFIEYYLETANMTEAYTRACRAAGHKANLEYANRYGKNLFDRLKAKINDALIQADVNDKALGRKVLRELAINSESDSVRATVGANLSKGLYPDHQVKTELTTEQIKDKLKANKEKIKQLHNP